jgi:hypothetical protein
MQVDLEQARRRAKELLRAARAGEITLRDDRAPRLADAQRAVARELGHRSWASLIAAAPSRSERVVEPGPEHVRGAPVRVRIRHRDRRYDIDDAGEAVRRAGRPPGWLDAARRAAEPININRAGVVFVQAVEGRDIDALARLVADRSIAVHDTLLGS